MPKSKETISDSDSCSGSGSEDEVKQKSKPKKQEKKKVESSESENSESEEDSKSKKRPKKSKSSDKGPASKKAKSGSDEWDIGNNKIVTVRNFKGKWFVDIREMYMDKSSGEMKPGKKGICLNLDNWKALKEVVEEVNECVKSK